MKNQMNKKILMVLIVGAIVIISPFTFKISVEAANEYTVLAPLPGTTLSDCQPGSDDCKTTLEKYLPGMFNLLIGLSATFAVLMIVIGGFQYMSSDSIMKTEKGKGRIKNSIYALILVIGAYLILYTINPKLLELNLNIESATVKGALNLNGTIINTQNTTDSQLTQAQASSALSGFTISSSGNCTDPTNSSCTSLAGMHSDTVAGLIALKTTCGTACSQLVITGGTETGHACGDPATCLSHQSGFKADISNTQGNGVAFTNFISQQVQAQNNVSMNTNGFYNISVGGFTYQVHPEGDHMDITVIPKNKK
jgi:hypothetical protein